MSARYGASVAERGIKLVLHELAIRGLKAERTTVGRSKNWLKLVTREGAVLLFVTQPTDWRLAKRYP